MGNLNSNNDSGRYCRVDSLAYQTEIEEEKRKTNEKTKADVKQIKVLQKRTKPMEADHQSNANNEWINLSIKQMLDKPNRHSDNNGK